MTNAPEHDEGDPLEVEVARDEEISLDDREAMLAALRQLRARHGCGQTE